MTREFSYPVTLSPEIKGAFTVTFPDIPEAITSGRNREEAFTQAADCLAFALAGRVRDGSDIQESSRRKGAYMIQVPLYLAPTLGLYVSMRESGIGNFRLAKKLGISEAAVRKGGSGGYCMYVVPSLDMVIYKMGGNDGQYDPKLTRLPVRYTYDGSRDGWKPDKAKAADATNRTLEMVVASIVR